MTEYELKPKGDVTYECKNSQARSADAYKMLVAMGCVFDKAGGIQVPFDRLDEAKPLIQRRKPERMSREQALDPLRLAGESTCEWDY